MCKFSLSSEKGYLILVCQVNNSVTVYGILWQDSWSHKQPQAYEKILCIIFIPWRRMTLYVLWAENFFCFVMFLQSPRAHEWELFLHIFFLFYHHERNIKEERKGCKIKCNESCSMSLSFEEFNREHWCSHVYVNVCLFNLQVPRS